MDKNELLKLISNIDDIIKKYSLDFQAVVKPIEIIFNFKTHNKQEFTNAHYVSDYLKDFFAHSDSLSFFARELPISYGVTKNNLNNVMSDVSGSQNTRKKYNKKGRFSVDAYFKVNIKVDSLNKSIDGQEIEHLFVEYKVSKLFKYVALAEDFIKYKIYTYNNEKNTAFTFVCFDNKEYYPTILKLNKPDYVLLSKRINKKMFTQDDRVFIYIPHKTSLISVDDNRPDFLGQLRKSHKLLERIVEVTSDLDENDISEGVQRELINNFYCENINAFKNNVATAKLLFNNYSNFIYPLYKELVVKGIIGDETQFDSDRLLKVKKDFKIYEQNVYGEKKLRSLMDGLSTGYKSSLNILILFNILALKYSVDLKPQLYYVDSESKSGRVKIDYNQILENNTKEIIENNEEYISLGVDLLIFIYNLYETIFEIDESGLYVYKKEYEVLKKAKKLQKLFDELRRLIKYDNKINMFGENIENETIMLFEYIFLQFGE